LTLAKARELGIEGLKIPNDNVNGATVPGAAAAWVDLHKAWGSGKLNLSEILEVSTPMLKMRWADGDCCSRQPDSQRRDSPFILKRRTRWVRNM
jgi:hypothetical protein